MAHFETSSTPSGTPKEQSRLIKLSSNNSSSEETAIKASSSESTEAPESVPRNAAGFPTIAGKGLGLGWKPKGDRTTQPTTPSTQDYSPEHTDDSPKYGMNTLVYESIEGRDEKMPISLVQSSTVSSPDSLLGNPYPPNTYDGDIPWAKVWSERTLAAKMNKTKMGAFLAACGLKDSEYAGMSVPAMARLVAKRQELNKRSLHEPKAQIMTQKPLKKRKVVDRDVGYDEIEAHSKRTKIVDTVETFTHITGRLQKRKATEDDGEEDISMSTKKIKTEHSDNPSANSTTSLPENPMTTSNQNKITAALKLMKRVQRTSMEFDLEEAKAEESDTEEIDEEIKARKEFKETVFVVDAKTRTPVISIEAQLRVGTALSLRDQVRNTAVRTALDAENRKDVLKELRLNWTKLKNEVAKHITGHDIDQKVEANKMLKHILGDDADGHIGNKRRYNRVCLSEKGKVQITESSSQEEANHPESELEIQATDGDIASLADDAIVGEENDQRQSSSSSEDEDEESEESEEE